MFGLYVPIGQDSGHHPYVATEPRKSLVTTIKALAKAVLVAMFPRS